MADQNNGYENGAENNGFENGAENNEAVNVPVAEENEAGDDIWNQIFDQNFVPDPNAYDYEAHHEVLLQNIQAGHQNMFLHHNGFPMPQQAVVQPEVVAHGSTSQPSGLNDVQRNSDLQSSTASSGNENSGAQSARPNLEGWGYVNEAYQTDSSSLSEFVASNESQQEVSSITTKGESPESRCFLEVPETSKKSNLIQKLMRRFDDSTENDQPNPPNTPVSIRSDVNISRSVSPVVDCSPKLATSPGICLRSAIKALSNIAAENREIFHSDFDSSEGRNEDLTKSKSEVESTKRASKLKIGKAKSSGGRIQSKRKSPCDPNEENIQISLSRTPDRPDYLFVKFGSFMVILILLFPLAIIACLQGLIPQKYMNLFLVLLILSIGGAFYFFIKACYVKKDDATSTSTVRYGSIQNPKPGTSAESA